MVSVAQSMFKFRRPFHGRVETNNHKDDDDDSTFEGEKSSRRVQSSSFSNVIAASKAKQKLTVPNPTKENTKLQRSSSNGASSSSNRRSRSSPPPRRPGRSAQQQQQLDDNATKRSHSATSSKRSVGTEKTALTDDVDGLPHDDENSVSSNVSASSDSISNSSSEESDSIQQRSGMKSKPYHAQSFAAGHPRPPPRKATGLETVKNKPPFVSGPTNKTNNQKQQELHRNKSSGDELLGKPISIGSSKLSSGNLSSQTVSVEASLTNENAATQQLAYLVVQLSSDLREATAAKEEAEEKVAAMMTSTSSSAASRWDEKLREENADLQADIDVFIAEQEDLQKEINILKEKNSAANDVIKRLTKSMGSSQSNAAACFEAKNEALESRVKELTDENHKLEKQIQLLVDEKQSLVCRDLEIDTMEKLMQDKEIQNESTIAELQAQISALEADMRELEKDAKEQKMNVALIEDQFEARQKLFEMEAKKMTLVRQRLSQVEKQNVELTSKNESLEQLLTTMKQEEQVIAGTLTNLPQTISELEEAKKGLETELAEALEVIAMLEDKLGSKDDQLKEALDQATNVQQQFSTKDTQNSTLNERNETLMKQIEELNTQIKVLVLEKEAANEELEVLKKSMQVDGKGENSEAVVVESILELEDKLSQLEESKHELEDKLYRLEESKQKLEEELEESSDAILMLKEALADLEDAKIKSNAKIEELEAELDRKEIAVKTAEASSNVLQSEHQINIDTISALQKMIQSLEKSKDDLEVELNLSSMALHDVKEDIRTKDSVILVKELESKLAETEKKNSELSGRIMELASANKIVESQVKDLGESVFSLTCRNSSDRAETCDALIFELKSHVKELVTERNAALEQVEALKRYSTRIETVESTESSAQRQTYSKISNQQILEPLKPAKPTCEKIDFSSSISPQDQPAKIAQPAESKLTSEKSNISGTVSTTSTRGSIPTRGSSLLEAAKKLIDKLDDQRGVSNNERESGKQDRGDRCKEDKDGTSSAKCANEPKEEPVKLPVEHRVSNVKTSKKDGEKYRSARSQRECDIDQLTSIHLDGESEAENWSKLSDLSSQGRSARRPPERKEGVTTKKVKICRNGVFLGTYEGALNRDGQRHGFGVLICDNGNSYEGEWTKDKRDGLGIARYSSGDVYDGEWLRGKRQGHGVMYIEAGDTYIGSWNNGVKHGAGTYYWADGEVDVSRYNEDRRVGEGVRWNSTRSKAYRLVRGAKKEEISLDEAYNMAEKLGLNLEKMDSSVSSFTKKSDS